jgi:hypothetical protein
MEANDIPSWTTIYRDLLNAYNNTKHSTTGFAPNDIQKEDIDTVRKNIKKIMYPIQTILILMI